MKTPFLLVTGPLRRVVRWTAVMAMAAWMSAPIVWAGAPETNAQENEEIFEAGKRMLKSEQPVEQALGVRLLEQLADKGYAKAESAYGYILASGRLVEPNESRAIEYLRRAAKAGEEPAQMNLSRLLLKASQSPELQKEGVAWLETAANSGSRDAQATLGEMYYFGDPAVGKDEAKAFQWMSRAAETGHVNSMNTVAFMLQTGQGVDKNPEAAVVFLKRAAEAGHAKAQASLGMAYAGANGVSKDTVEAYKWLMLGYKQGEVTAENALVDFLKGVTPAQKEDGDRRIAEYLAQHGAINATRAPQSVAQ